MLFAFLVESKLQNSPADHCCVRYGSELIRLLSMYLTCHRFVAYQGIIPLCCHKHLFSGKRKYMFIHVCRMAMPRTRHWWSGNLPKYACSKSSAWSAPSQHEPSSLFSVLSVYIDEPLGWCHIMDCHHVSVLTGIWACRGGLEEETIGPIRTAQACREEEQCGNEERRKWLSLSCIEDESFVRTKEIR